MNKDVDLLRRETKQPVRLDDFQALIHHRGRVDSDAPTHFPDGMLQGLFGGYAIKMLPRRFQKRATGSSQYETADFRMASRPKTLMDGAMFAIHRQDLGSPLPRHSCDQLTRRDKNLLVRQPDSFSSLDRLIGRNQPRRPMGSRHDGINLRMRRRLDLPAHPTGNLDGWGNSEISKLLAQGLNQLRIPDHHQPWSEITDLLGKQLQVLSGAEGDHMKSVRSILHDRETLPPNRTRGA